MSTKDNGGPAFPGLHPSDECRYQDEGMTLRDELLAAAELAEKVLTLNRMPLEDYFTQPRIVEMRSAVDALRAAIAKVKP